MKENITEKVNSYYKSMQSILREITPNKIKTFNTAYKNAKRFKKFLYFGAYHILEIREQDAVDVFMAGFKNELEFHKRLEIKYNIDNN